MRHHGNLALTVVTTLSLFIASSASAVSLTLNVDNVFTAGFAPSGAAVITPNSISGVVVGDFIALSVDIENSGGDLINSIFTTLTIDPALFSLFGGTFATSILFVPGSAFPPVPDQSLGQIGAGPVIKVASLPLGDQVQAMAFASGNGSVGTGPDISAATIILEVTAAGSFNLELGFFFSNDLIQLNGVNLVGAAAAAVVPVTNPLIAVTVPEPSSYALSLAGLTTVFGIASVRRRVGVAS